MDTVPRRRRSVPGPEPEADSDLRDQAYTTALSQAGQTGQFVGGVCGGEASPSTLEMAGAPGLNMNDPLPTANPFHSDRARSEVELIRARPVTLDEDAQRVRGENDEPTLGDATVGGSGLEPDYDLVLGPAGSGSVVCEPELPRVARIEASAESAGYREATIGEQKATNETRAAPPGKAGGTEEPMDRLDHQCSALVGAAVPAGRIAADDSRELVPVELDRLARVELLLAHVVEENHSLKRQLQTESNSSWHSTRTPAELPPSPMSFGLGAQFSEALPPQAFNAPCTEPLLPRDFPGSVAGLAVKDLGPVSPQGQPAAFPRVRPPSGLVGSLSGEVASVEGLGCSGDFGWGRVPGPILHRPQGYLSLGVVSRPRLLGSSLV